MITTGKTFADVAGISVVTAIYSLSFWRLFKSNTGNRLIECGSLTLIVFVTMIPISKLGEIPDRLFAPWLFLIVLLCFATLFFLFQRIFRAVRKRLGY